MRFMKKAQAKGHALVFFNAIIRLSEANYLTGVWDNRRNSLCKKAFEEFTDQEKAYLYHTEKMSRKNVELRAVHRTAIDRVFREIINISENLPYHE